MSQIDNYPGRRLSFSGALCTVRYVGLIEGTKGDWLGVEWDDPSRGKHDGSHNRVRYFECRSASVTAASFIRPARPSDQSISFFEALKKKYASSSAEEIADTANEIRISGKTVEEVGFEKIRQQLSELQELRTVVLDGACIAVAESDLDQQNLKIIELDLSRNLLESWSDITTICKSLRSLKSLSLDGNTFSRPQDPFQDDEPTNLHGQLRELSLNNVGFLQQTATGMNGNLSWEYVKNFAAKFPSLATLSLASNNFTAVTLPLATPLLTKLDFSCNAFTTLEGIHPLTALPNLQSLSLRANPLTSLASPPDKRIIFPKLKHLDLTSTILPTLSSLNPITTSFPVLASLLTNHTPMTTYPSASLSTIARLATLTSLNYSLITPPERQNAELYYLSQIAKQLASATDHTEERQTLAEHPRWKQLCDIHGEPTIARKLTTTEAAAAASTAAGTLGARVAAFTLYMNNEDLQTAQKHAASIKGHSAPSSSANAHRNDRTATTTTGLTVKRKLVPLTVSTTRLKGIVAQLFDVRPLSIRLVYESEEWDPVLEDEADEEGGGGEWSVSEDSSSSGDDDDDDDGELTENEKRERGVEEDKKKKKKDAKWKRRELELVDSTREVGFFVDGGGKGREARVRVELR